MPDAPAQPDPSPPRWYARTVWWATIVCLVIILGSNVVRNSIILKSYWALGLLLAGAAWAPALRGGNLIGRWSVRQWLLGVIGLASTEPSHFGAGMGTLFLGQLGELVSAGIACHLDD